MEAKDKEVDCVEIVDAQLNLYLKKLKKERGKRQDFGPYAAGQCFIHFQMINANSG